MDFPRISVIVPVYNVEKYLKHSVESLLNQTYDNMEVILIDDGSTDKSGLICDELSAGNSQIKVIHKKNEGVSSARNAGLTTSTGEYIAFLDSDDYVAKDMLMDMFKNLQEDNADIVCCGYHTVYEEDMENEVHAATPFTGSQYGIEAFGVFIKDGYYTTSIWNKLFKKSVIWQRDGMILFQNGLTVGEDELWLFRILSKGRFKTSFIKNQYYYWVQRQGSALHSDQMITRQRLDEVFVKEVIFEECLKIGSTDLVRPSGCLLFQKSFDLYRIAKKNQDCELCDRLETNLKRSKGYWAASRNITVRERLRTIYWVVRLKMGHRLKQ